MATPTLRRDALLATLLALVLGATWAWRGWADLQALRLPDTDDVMRLQQVRDWLGGQPFADVSQRRLGEGLPMHWTRVADLGPAALILTLRPLFGAHGAEVATVALWPVLLLALALFLVARIARALGGAELAGTAAAVAAIGYPATTLFLPGRIDHHGLQMVLLLGAVLSLLRPATVRAGAICGLLAAASLAIGLETAPVFAALGAVAVAEWAWTRPNAAARLFGLGVGAAFGLVLARAVFATSAWGYPACDGFTGQAWRAALVLSAAPLALAVLGARVSGWRARVPATVAIGGAATAIALSISPSCLHPYDQVSPALARLWLAQVGEAQAFVAAPPATAIGYAGLMLAGVLASAWRFRVTRARGWSTLLAAQLASVAITLFQLRGAYAGALLAAPGLAAVIASARARGALPVAGAWLASAGMLYPIAAQALTPAATLPTRGRGDCASPALLAALGRLPPGLVVAPIDAGPAILAATRQRVLSAPYHRNDTANLAAYRFYLGDPGQAQAVATRWRATAWLSCAAMPGPARARGLPGWTARNLPDGAGIWTRDGLSGVPARR